MPKVSVLMPVYNTKEEYLREAIESILNQTFTDFEFIILNDGSTDENVEKVIKSYDDKRIKFINNTNNQGFIASLNQCLDISQGEYLAKMDSDDISLPDRLEKQVKYLDTYSDVGLVGCGYKAFDKDNFSKIHSAQVNILSLLEGCCTTIFMLRKSIVEKYNLRFRKEYIHAEDYDFYARFIRFAQIKNIQEVLYLYRWHGENVSITNAQEQAKSSNKVRQDILDFLTDDKELQQKIMNLVCPPPAQTNTPKLKYTFWQRIFSLRNHKINGQKKKILMICGVKIKLKCKEDCSRLNLCCFCKKNIISFDIFDTLLVRPYAKPSDLFLHLEKLENRNGFYQERIKAEQKARDKYSDVEEITLQEIYQEINPIFKDMYIKEMQLEEQVLQPNPEIQKLYHKLIKKSKRVIITSDMYLPQSFIEKILKKNGYTGYEKLYLSSTYKKTKQSGSLFKYICDDLNLSPNRICHIGDNMYSDIDVPRKMGLKVVYVKKIIDKLYQKRPNLSKYYNTNPTLGKSILVGLFALNDNKGKYWNNLGKYFAGPVMVAFSQWIHNQVVVDKIKHLLFIARDGYILQKVFNLLYPMHCDSTYLYAPRFIKKENESLCMRYKKYLEVFDLPRKDIAMIDSVTVNFSSQKLLRQYLAENVLGYYWTARPEDKQKFLSFNYKEFDKNKESFFTQWGLMELFLTAPNSPIIDFDNGNPVFAKSNKWEQRRIKACTGIEKGVLDFTRQVIRIFGEKELFITEKDARDLVDILAKFPQKIDVKYLSRIRHPSDIYNAQYEPLMLAWKDMNRSILSRFIFKVKHRDNKKKYYFLGVHILTLKG